MAGNVMMGVYSDEHPSLPLHGVVDAAVMDNDDDSYVEPPLYNAAKFQKELCAGTAVVDSAEKIDHFYNLCLIKRNAEVSTEDDDGVTVVSPVDECEFGPEEATQIIQDAIQALRPQLERT